MMNSDDEVNSDSSSGGQVDQEKMLDTIDNRNVHSGVDNRSLHPEGHKREHRKKGFLSRRGAVGSLVGAVAGIPSLLGRARAADTTEIPYVWNKTGERLLKSEHVPEPWWNHIQRVRNVTSDVRSKFKNKPNVESVGYGPGGKTFAGKRGMAIHVGVASGETQPELPSEVDGIPVVTEEVKPEFIGTSTCVHLNRFDPAPGGVHLRGESAGSTAYKVVSENARAGMLTAHHLFACSGDSTAKTAKQCGTKVGEVGQNSNSVDFAIVKGDSPFDDTVLHNDEVRYPTSGYYSKAALEDKAGDNDTVYTTGMATGTTKGTIDQVGVSASRECNANYEGEGVKLTNTVAQGDSGGIAYDLETVDIGDTYATLIMPLSRGDNEAGTFSCSCSCDSDYCGKTLYKYNGVYGTGHYHLNNDYNIDIF